MNFPIDEPFFQFLYWLLNTAGIGGIVVSLAGGGTLLAFTLVFLWIRQGGYVVDEEQIYTYPTPGLHPHEESSP